MRAKSSKSGWLLAGVIRGNMLGKVVLPGDEELGKKDDDHKPGGVSPRMPNWVSVKAPLRWRRRRILLFLVGLYLVYLFIKNIQDLGIENGRRSPNDDFGFGGVITPPADEQPSRVVDSEPTGPPPGSRTPRAGEPVLRAYEGPIKFYRLAASIHSATHTNGYRQVNRNVLFAMSSLKSASTLLPVICEMARWSKSWVHAAIMGKETISMAELLEINGIDEDKCPVIWHDARPDFMEYSTDQRAESSVISAMTHIYGALHPQVIIVDDALVENDFFVRGIRAKTKMLGMPVIEGPQNWDNLMWMTRLDSASLRSWHHPTVEILIQVPPHSSSIIRLLKSIRAADYSGLNFPHLTIELPGELDVSVRMYLESFTWPPDGEQNLITIRRRVTNYHATQEDSAIRLLELFYPSSTSNSHVLLLSPQAELSAQYYQYIMYTLMKYRYSSFGAVDSANVMGISLELPSTLLDGKSKLTHPKAEDMDSDRYEELFSNTQSVPFLWQAPNSHASLFFGSKWAELHSFLSNRVAKHHQLPKTAPRSKLVSETFPSWMEYMLEFMRARGYSLFYPGASTAETLVAVHNELYHAPEEFGQPTLEEAEGHKLSEEPFLRADKPATLAKNKEPTLIPRSRPLHQALPFDGDLPEIAQLPYFLYNGIAVAPENVSMVAGRYAEEFGEVVGGCKKAAGKHRVVVQGSTRDLFCFGDEKSEDWEDDVVVDDAPIKSKER
jgi:hypothetical protein